MINIKKCKFLVPSIDLLGYTVFNSKYQLGPKALSKWAEVTLPRTLKQLQAVLGLLNFCAGFVPKYKQLVKPIEALLSKKRASKWDAKCTDALNKIVTIIF